MKERPILFNGPIAGTKTQTRRKVKGVVEQGGAYSLDAHMQGNFPLCPYGVPGDRLWVKETFAVVEGGDPLVTFCSDGSWGMNPWVWVVGFKRLAVGAT